MEKLNKLDLMMVEEVTSHVLREMEEDEKKGEKIDRQKEFDLRTLRRKIELMRMQERKGTQDEEIDDFVIKFIKNSLKSY